MLIKHSHFGRQLLYCGVGLLVFKMLSNLLMVMISLGQEEEI